MLKGTFSLFICSVWWSLTCNEAVLHKPLAALLTRERKTLTLLLLFFGITLCARLFGAWRIPPPPGRGSALSKSPSRWGELLFSVTLGWNSSFFQVQALWNYCMEHNFFLMEHPERSCKVIFFLKKRYKVGYRKLRSETGYGLKFCSHLEQTTMNLAFYINCFGLSWQLEMVSGQILSLLILIFYWQHWLGWGQDDMLQV